ncbi:MAG: protein-disulfide isomerase [Acidimicrobiia bacterium]|nr:protein-disulfide isomerase [Acidimicrobiia bacterium]
MHFGITFDYLCPFARNAAEAVLNGVEEGRDWQPRYVAFSLAQAHTAEDEPDVWDKSSGKSGVLALQWGLAARDSFPEIFPAVHRALFAARHDDGRDINDEAILRKAVTSAGADPDAIAAVVAIGSPKEALAADHMEAAGEWSVFGVPTFLAGDDATFVRFMSRGDVEDLQRVLDMLSWTNLNEFKRTTTPR